MTSKFFIIFAATATIAFAAEPIKPAVIKPVQVTPPPKTAPAQPQAAQSSVPTLNNLRKKLIDWNPFTQWFDAKPLNGSGAGDGSGSSTGSDSSSGSGTDSGAGGDPLGLARLRNQGAKKPGGPQPGGVGQQAAGGPQSGLAPDPGTQPPGGAGAGAGGGGGGGAFDQSGGITTPGGKGEVFDKWWPICAFIDSTVSQEKGNESIKGMVDMAAQCKVNVVVFPITIKTGYGDAPDPINQAARAACNMQNGFSNEGSVTTLVPHPLSAAKMCESKIPDPNNPGQMIYDPATAGCAELRQGSTPPPPDPNDPNYARLRAEYDKFMTSGEGRNAAGTGIGASIEVPIGHTAKVVAHEAMGHSQMGKPNGSRYGNGIGEFADFGPDGTAPEGPPGWTKPAGCDVMYSKALPNTKKFSWDPTKQSYYNRIDDVSRQYNLFGDPPLFGGARPPPPGGPATPPDAPPAGPPRIIFQDDAPKVAGGGGGTTPPATGVPAAPPGKNPQGGNPPTASEDERHKRKPGAPLPIAEGGSPKDTYKGDPPTASESPQDRLRRGAGETDSGKRFNPSVTYDDNAPKVKGGGSNSGGAVADRGKADAAPGAYPGSSTGSGFGSVGDGSSPDGGRATEYDPQSGTGVMSSRLAGGGGGGGGSSIQYDDNAPKGSASAGGGAGGYVGLGRGNSEDVLGGLGANGRNPASVGSLKPMGSALQNDFFNAVGDGYEDEREIKRRKIQGMTLRKPGDPNAKERALSLGGSRTPATREGPAKRR